MAPFPYAFIDLTHTLHPNIPSWTGGCGFHSEIKLDYDSSTQPSFRVQQFKMHGGIGTHMDVPAHCVPGGVAAHTMPLSLCAVPAVVIDVRLQAVESYSVSLVDVKNFEAKYGRLTPGACVLIHTGWGRLWDDGSAYHNNHTFPSVAGDAARYLVDCGIVGLGIDTLSPDRPRDGFPVHEAILGSGGYILENVANLGAMPAVGGFIMALPLKIEGGTESPVRCVGLVPDHEIEGCDTLDLEK